MRFTPFLKYSYPKKTQNPSPSPTGKNRFGFCAFGTSVHNGLNQNELIPAAGTHIPNIFIGTFDFLKALLYNGIKGGRMKREQSSIAVGKHNTEFLKQEPAVLFMKVLSTARLLAVYIF